MRFIAKQLLACSIAAVMMAGAGMPLCDAGATSVRIKDIAHIKGVRNNQLVGYGLVVGLNRTGDQSISTQISSANLINNFDGRLQNPNDIRPTNTAAVIVTALVPPFAKAGDPIDVIVSSLADAKSLEGGVLVNTALKAPNGEIIALAQGALSTGGTSVSANGSSKRTAITTTARIPNGAIMEREIHTDIGTMNSMDLVLDRTDFTLASRVSDTVSSNLASARAIDGSTIRVLFPNQYIDNRVAFMAKLENLTVETTQEIAKVVVNERTGTVVIGSNVKLLPAAVAHGGITVTVATRNEVSQPDGLGGAGQTVGVSNSEIEIVEEPGNLVKLSANASLDDLVAALNALGVSPSDLISVLQALKAAGSLEASLEII
ncbi:MAG: flagellar basal body P-ring protein FlgI [Cyanobacteria bacterium P01_H01_bin.74]